MNTLTVEDLVIENINESIGIGTLKKNSFIGFFGFDRIEGLNTNNYETFNPSRLSYYDLVVLYGRYKDILTIIWTSVRLKKKILIYTSDGSEIIKVFSVIMPTELVSFEVVKGLMFIYIIP